MPVKCFPSIFWVAWAGRDVAHAAARKGNGQAPMSRWALWPGLHAADDSGRDRFFPSTCNVRDAHKALGRSHLTAVAPWLAVLPSPPGGADGRGGLAARASAAATAGQRVAAAVTSRGRSIGVARRRRGGRHARALPRICAAPASWREGGRGGGRRAPEGGGITLRLRRREGDLGEAGATEGATGGGRVLTGEQRGDGGGSRRRGGSDGSEVESVCPCVLGCSGAGVALSYRR